MSNEYEFLKKLRYEYYKGTNSIIDNEVDKLVEDVVDVLNQKDFNINELLKIKQIQAERIAELEEQLKNVIPFKTGQPLYSLNKRANCIYELSFEKFMYKARRLKDGYVGNYSKEELFTTKEEAQAKLEELKGENK